MCVTMCVTNGDGEVVAALQPPQSLDRKPYDEYIFVAGYFKVPAEGALAAAAGGY